MASGSRDEAAIGRLEGARVTLREALIDDVPELTIILNEPAVTHWWGRHTTDQLERELTDAENHLLVIEVEGETAGIIEFSEIDDPMYHSASIDIALATRFHDRGLGSDAVRTMARYLIDERGHHRLTIDPAVANQRAVAAYRKSGFRPVGVMRQYELGLDGSFHDGLLMDLLREDFVRQ